MLKIVKFLKKTLDIKSSFLYVVLKILEGLRGNKNYEYEQGKKLENRFYKKKNEY